MTGLGTDVLALTCILCGAATGGGLTWAFMDADAMDLETCAMEAVSVAPTVVVTRGSGSRVVTISEPRVRVGGGDCGDDLHGSLVVDLNRVRSSIRRVEVDAEGVRGEMEAARAEADRAREELVHLRERMDGRADTEARTREVRILLKRPEETGGSGGGH